MNDKVYQSLIKLCVDICRRNGKKKLIWFGDKNKTLNYNPKSDEMVLTVHRWFANKSCPGNWLYARLGDLAAKVTAQLGGNSGGASEVTPTTSFYRVRKSWSDAKSQKGAFKSLENAKRCAKANPGYYVFDDKGQVVGSNASAPTNTKTVDTLAREVIQGKWGNGADRKNRLTAAGYNYSAVQKRGFWLTGLPQHSHALTITSSTAFVTVLTPPSPFLLQNVFIVLMDKANASAISL